VKLLTYLYNNIDDVEVMLLTFYSYKEVLESDGSDLYNITSAIRKAQLYSAALAKVTLNTVAWEFHIVENAIDDDYIIIQNLMDQVQLVLATAVDQLQWYGDELVTTSNELLLRRSLVDTVAYIDLLSTLRELHSAFTIYDLHLDQS